jgi:N-acetyl-gamma-glutamylphosphate reductase
VEILFQPHVAAFDRGILSSIYCTATQSVTAARLQEIYLDFYRGEPFVQVLSKPPALKLPHRQLENCVKRIERQFLLLATIEAPNPQLVASKLLYLSKLATKK